MNPMADKSEPPKAPAAGVPIPAVSAPNAEAKPPTKPAAPQGNPAFRAMGLPNWKLKLPSRNWTIFLTIVGSWTGALLYDRRMKKKEQQKWCTLVSHVAQETLPTNTLPRKITIYLAAPPGDGLRVAREHFTEYVKPVLVAGGLDWDVVEGRREGELRAGLADRIRKMRRRKGEAGEMSEEELNDLNVRMEALRERMGVEEYSGQKGDVVIGRHTWKEYVRGLHEGWLGPLDAPVVPPTAPDASAITPDMPESQNPSSELVASSETVLPTAHIQDDSPRTDSPLSTTTADSPPSTTTPPTPDTETPKKEEPKKEDTPPEKPPPTLPYISTPDYPSVPLPSTLPSELSASAAIPFPHILGFRNTPIRMYRYLTQRYVADDIGRQTASIVLATYRPYMQGTSSDSSTSATPQDSSYASSTSTDLTSSTSTTLQTQNQTWEQQRLLVHEEKDWWKVKRTPEDEGKERVLLDDIIIDSRIGERMRKFELDADDEERARRIGRGSAGIPGRRVGVKEGEDEGRQER